MSGYDTEPVRGLPEPLPEGEHILWQGAPDWRAMALRAFHVRKLAIYFAVLLAWLALARLADGGTIVEAALAMRVALPLALAALAILCLFAWLTSRATLYTITNRRVVLRIGIALPMCVNIPFRIVESAALKRASDRTGDIPLALKDDGRIAYLVLWPHARPGRFSRPEPMLRGVPDAGRVADILARALAAAAGLSAPRLVLAPEREARPAPAPSGEIVAG